MSKPIQHLRRTSTEASLKNSLLALLQEKPLDKITIKEVCEHAGIYRTTFYSHFNTLPDLLTSIEEEIMNDFRSAISALYQEQVSVTDFSISLLNYMLKKKAYFQVILTVPYCENCKNNLIQQLSSDIYHLSAPYSSPLKGEYYPIFLAGGIIACLTRWITSDEPASVYAMSEMLHQMTHQANLNR